MTHDAEDVRQSGLVDQCMQGSQLGRERRNIRDPDRSSTLAEKILEVGPIAAAQVLLLVRDDDAVRAAGAQLTDGPQDVIGAVTGHTEHETHAAPGGWRPRSTSSNAATPASLWARSTTTVTPPNE